MESILTEKQIEEYEQKELAHYKKLQLDYFNTLTEEQKQKYLESEKRIDEEHAKLADDLEHSLVLLKRLIKCLRGKAVDWTGLGIERIFKSSLERALNVQILEQHYFEYLLGIEKKYRELDLNVTNVSNKT